MVRLLRCVLLMAFGGLFVGVSGAAAAPAPPALVGSVANTGSLSGTTSVAVSGQYAYTTAYWAGVLTAVDISSPTAPSVAGSSAPALSLYDASTVNIAGGYAFVASKNRNASPSSNDDGTGNSLTILDVHTNPAAPAIVGTLQDPANLFGAYGVASSGTYAYVASQGLLAGQPTSPDTSTGAFSIIDLTSLAAPAIVGHLDNGSLPSPWTGTNALQHVTSVAISGNYAYVTAFGSDRLTVIDISTPTSPKIVASLHDTTNLVFPADVAVSGNYAYIADQTGSSQTNFAVVDISNPLSPRVVGSVAPQSALSGAYRVRVSGSFAYVSASNTATVAAIDISDPTNPRVAGSVTNTASLNKTTGLDFDPSGGYVIASSPRVPMETNPVYPPFPTTTGTISAIQLDPVPIAVTIGSEPPPVTSQANASFSFAPSDQVATAPQCQLDGAPFTACTSLTAQSYSSLSPGSHTFTVQTADVLGTPATASYTWTIGSPPAPGQPAISGTAAVGSQLSVTNGNWGGNPAPTFTYAWSDCGATGGNCGPPIPGATSSTYTVQPSDVGFALEATVTGTNGVGSPASATSAPTGVVPPPAASATAPANTTAPVISGTSTVGSTLTASVGAWTGNPAPTFSYQWVRCDGHGANCAAVTGASAQTYVAATADAGSTLEVMVTATNAGGSASVSSAPTSIITVMAIGPADRTAPAISGAAAIGRTLSCGSGAWTGSSPISYAYSWTRDGRTIAGATRATYVIATADAKHKLGCTVRATNAVGSAAAASATLPAPTGSAQLGRPKALHGGAVSVTVSCARVAGTVCHLTLKVTAVTKTGKTTKTVVIASKSLTLGAGQRRTLTLSPGRASLKLLAAQPKLRAGLALVELGSNGQASTLPAQRITLAP